MLVIFDCDGVLVDSERLSNAILSHCLRDAGLDLTFEQTVAEFMGRSRKHLMARAAQLRGEPLTKEWEAGYEERRDAAFRAGLRAVEGIEEAIDGVEAAGHATCVASSGDHGKMRLTLGLTGLYDRFDGRIFSATEVEHAKPAPDLFLYAAERMGFAPADCVVVEDSPAGVEAGRAARMRVLHYGGEFTDMRELPGLL